MKKLNILFITLSLLIGFQSCKKKESQPKESETTEKSLSIDQSTVEVKWTAYKTTDKIAVSGVFNEVNISNESGTTVNEIIDGLEFSIPVSSVFSNNEDRDNKLKEFFFGAMENTSLLSGNLSLDAENKKVNSQITMNNVTENLSLDHKIDGNNIKLSGVIDLEKWKVLSAVESINKICFDLHKGPDGVSKTWNDVRVDISFTIK